MVIITFFVLDRTMGALAHGDKHNEEEGSISDETRSAQTSLQLLWMGSYVTAI